MYNSERILPDGETVPVGWAPLRGLGIGTSRCPGFDAFVQPGCSGPSTRSRNRVQNCTYETPLPVAWTDDRAAVAT